MHGGQRLARHVEAGGRSPEHGREIETEAVHTGIQNEMPEGIDDELANIGMVAGNRVAGAGIVDQHARFSLWVAEGGEIVEPAQRQDRALDIAFTRMVEDEIENDADAFRMQRRNRISQFPHAAGAEARIERHEADGIITPGIGKAERRQVALVDPSGDRHQFHRIDADFFQVCENGGMGKCCDGASDVFRHLGMQLREGFDGKLINQPAFGKKRLMALDRLILGKDRLRHDLAGLRAKGVKRWIVSEGAVDLRGIGIEQQLCGIEPEAVFRGVNAVSAKAVSRAEADVGDDQSVNIVFAAHHRQARRFFFADFIEKAEIDLGGMPGIDREFRSVFRLDCAFGENGSCLHGLSLRGWCFSPRTGKGGKAE
ncbi:hypothetical protein D3C71_492480 [compost metagenome]